MNYLEQRIAISCYVWDKTGRSRRAGRLRGQLKRGEDPDITGVRRWDLLDMHEAEKVLTADQFYIYATKYLPEAAGDTHPVSANEAQRRKAFLRTLNLWTE